jgi:hypothetical protein
MACLFCYKKAHLLRIRWAFGAPDEIRTHIDGTGNHNSIH